MKVRWLKTALRSLTATHQFIAHDNPQAAAQVIVRLERIVERLASHPHSGRQGTVVGTREIVVPGLPYLIVYRITSDEVHILRVFHTSRQPH